MRKGVKMKKLWMLTILTGLIVSSALAQTDTKAKAILAQVSKKYRNLNMLKSDFSLSIDNPQGNIKESREGTLFAQPKTNKYKVAMKDQDVISDGKSQWTYLKDDKEVQIAEADQGEDAINPARIFTLYEKGYKYLYVGEKKVRSTVYQVIDLSPLDTKKPFFKIRLTVNKNAKEISNVVIFEKNGNKYTYDIKSFVPNANIPEATFAFDAKKYPGIEVVDLR